MFGVIRGNLLTTKREGTFMSKPFKAVISAAVGAAFVALTGCASTHAAPASSVNATAAQPAAHANACKGMAHCRHVSGKHHSGHHKNHKNVHHKARKAAAKAKAAVSNTTSSDTSNTTTAK